MTQGSIAHARIAAAPGGAVMPPHFSVHYHAGTVNYCPACAGTHWLVGRASAQCAHCDTALPLACIAETPMRPLFTTRARFGTRAA